MIIRHSHDILAHTKKLENLHSHFRENLETVEQTYKSWLGESQLLEPK